MKLREIFRTLNDGDRWGTAINLWFEIADELHFRRQEAVPESWQYRPGIGEAEPDGLIAEML